MPPKIIFTYYNLSLGTEWGMSLNEVNALFTEMDEVFRDESGIPTQFTKDLKNPKFKGFRTVWILKSVEVNWE